MSKRMEGPCVIPGCSGAGIKHGVTLVECDNLTCGFSATVEHWVALASILPLRSGHSPGPPEVWIVAFEDDLTIADICDDEEYAEERADKLPTGACVLGPYKVTGVDSARKSDTGMCLADLEKFVKRIADEVGKHDNRLDQLEEER